MSKSKKRNTAGLVMVAGLAVAMLLWIALGVRREKSGLAALLQRGRGAVSSVRPVPVEIQRVARVALPEARSVVVDGEWAWVGQNLSGMTLLNTAIPSRPRVVRTFGPEDVRALAVTMAAPRLLAIADRFRGLRLWDVSSPSDPVEIASLLLPGLPTHMEAFETRQGRFLAVSAGGAGLVFVDISEPGRPVLASHFAVDADFSRQVTVRDGLALLADHADGGLKLFDVSSPEEPRILLKVAMGGFCESLAWEDNMAYVGYRNSGIRVFRMHRGEESRSTTPTLELMCALYRSQNRVRGLALLEDILLAVADDEAGVALYDVSVPHLPVLAAEYRFLADDGVASGIIADRGYLYVPSWSGGLNIFLVRPAGEEEKAEEERLEAFLRPELPKGSDHAQKLFL